MLLVLSPTSATKLVFVGVNTNKWQRKMNNHDDGDNTNIRNRI